MARVLPLDSAEHRDSQALLPWFVNGTLEAAEASRVEVHLGQCARCQADAASIASLRSLAADAEPVADVDRSWASLRGRLDATPQARPRPATPARWAWPRWAPVALGLQAALVLVLAVVLHGAPREAEPYRTLAAAPGAATPNALVVFRATATEAQIRAALRSSQARIVGGPTVTDAYLLRVADLGPEAMARLRAEPAILRIESLEAEARR
jgi:anti-sigma factor RsiW